MRDFDFIVSPAKLLTPEIVQMVSSIHEHKGKQELFLEANVDELKTLLEVALVQSTGASNRIEGIFTSDKRLEELVSQKAEPRNRSEQEIAGYREVLSTIHEGYEYINPRPNIILQLHRDLYSYSQGSAGGSYKNSDNVIAETDAEGHQKARFIPVPAFQTDEAMEELKNYADEDIFVVGGEKVYKEFFPYCERAYITKVDYEYQADAYLENLEESDEWIMTHDSDEWTYYDLEYYFYQYKRR